VTSLQHGSPKVAAQKRFEMRDKRQVLANRKLSFGDSLFVRDVSCRLIEFLILLHINKPQNNSQRVGVQRNILMECQYENGIGLSTGDVSSGL
jgi:hypothetical protein